MFSRRDNTTGLKPLRPGERERRRVRVRDHVREYRNAAEVADRRWLRRAGRGDKK